MSERHASHPPEQGSAAMAVGAASDGAIDVAIEEGEPEIAKPVAKVPEAAPSSHRGGAGGERRARAKVTLKIPDDEVSRPQVTPSAPPARAEPPPEAPPMTPMRIITIEPPAVVTKPSAPPAPQPRTAQSSPPPSVARANATPDSASAPGGPGAGKPATEDSWTPYQPTAADRAASAQPPVVAPPPPLPPMRPRSPSYASAPGSVPPAPQPPAAPPRPGPSVPSPPLPPVAAIPLAPPTVPMAPPTEPHASDSIDDIPIVTDEPPPSSGEIEVDEDARPTRPGVLKVPEPKLVLAQQSTAPPPPVAAPRVETATVHTAVTPVAAPVIVAPTAVAPVAPIVPPPAAASLPPVAVASPPPAVASAPGPVAPTPPRVAAVPAATRSQPQVSIKDLPPMRSLAPTEPEGLEVHFEEEEAPVSSGRTSEPEAEIAAEDLVSVESAPAPKQVAPTNQLSTETPGRAFLPVGLPAPAAPSAAASTAPQPSRGGSVPPPAFAGGAARPSTTTQKPTPRVIVPTASALAPPPMNESAATGRRKARPWWEELFNDDFIRTMAKITDAQIAKEVDFVEESLAVAKGAMLLDLGCGTGRHAIELTRRGYKVVGFDLSLPMLAKAAEEAQERSQKLNFVQGDMREMTFEDTFDGIYCWNTSFGFFEEDKNIQVIQRVHKALKKGGQFMLEVGNRDYIIRQAPSLAWFEGDGCICMDEMSIDWITSRMKVKRTMMMDDGRTKEIDNTVRLYSLHELGKILHDAGFRVAEVSGRTGTPGVYFGNESPRTMILAEKK